MKPALFATSQSLRTGASDKDRRESLAKWMTSPENPWFARAFVNRLWGELVGEGFYEPLDDMGPDRTPAAPRTMELLAEQFVANGHNVIRRPIHPTFEHLQKSNYQPFFHCANRHDGFRPDIPNLKHKASWLPGC